MREAVCWPSADFQNEKYYPCVMCGGAYEEDSDVVAGEKLKYGRYYPESQTGEIDGKRLCLDHYRLRMNAKTRDGWRMDIDEGDRQ